MKVMIIKMVVIMTRIKNLCSVNMICNIVKTTSITINIVQENKLVEITNGAQFNQLGQV